jgi:hypothetical protein
MHRHRGRWQALGCVAHGEACPDRHRIVLDPDLSKQACSSFEEQNQKTPAYLPRSLRPGRILTKERFWLLFSKKKGFASSIGVSLSRRAGMGTGVDCRHAPKREIFQQKGGLALFFLLDRPGGYGKMLCHRWEGWPCRHMY